MCMYVTCSMYSTCIMSTTCTCIFSTEETYSYDTKCIMATLTR